MCAYVARSDNCHFAGGSVALMPAALPISPAGEGTDNRMYRLGDQLFMRLPRTPDNAKAVRKEQTWLPRPAPHVPCRGLVEPDVLEIRPNP